MKIALIQFKPTFLDLETNLARASEILGTISADIAVFPELFLSGYTFADDDQARACAFWFEDGRHLAPLLRISREKSMAICGGYAELDDGDIYNSAFFMADGILQHNYRKVHLFNREKFSSSRSTGLEQRLPEMKATPSPASPRSFPPKANTSSA